MICRYLKNDHTGIFAFRLESSTTSALSATEKKDIVKAFIKQFLDDNPEAALDPKLMAGLSEKANQLIDCSFHLDDDCNAP